MPGDILGHPFTGDINMGRGPPGWGLAVELKPPSCKHPIDKNPTREEAGLNNIWLTGLRKNIHV